MTQLTIRTADGEAPAFEYGTGPSALLFIDGLGMRPAMHEMAAKLAGGGYRVLMPDLFYRIGPYAPLDPAKFMADADARNAWFKKLMGTPLSGYMDDTRAYLAHLEGKVGVTGYCMGGRLSLVAAETFPDRIAAVAAYHPGGLVTGAPDSPHLHVAKIKGEVYIGGAIEDANFTDEQRQQLDDALTAAGVDHTVELYQARHGWVPTDTQVHDPAAAARHWDTLFALFAKKLR